MLRSQESGHLKDLRTGTKSQMPSPCPGEMLESGYSWSSVSTATAEILELSERNPPEGDGSSMKLSKLGRFSFGPEVAAELFSRELVRSTRRIIFRIIEGSAKLK
ncbi:hypothetical protein RvY_13765 [Ramazzottius varieornatus]|uniref:Uncharacterized protein n=1 Tax=Ramazzottius varieornatus TaxID=947166 RepID=A0A1D1VT15_RAMVA|nr:hypothetical protein RvY_13765 [Ramazzottius varieornatus]